MISMNGDLQKIYNEITKTKIITARLEEKVDNIDKNFEKHLRNHEKIENNIRWLNAKVWFEVGGVTVLGFIIASGIL